MNWKVGTDIYTRLLLCINRELMRICGDLTRKEIEMRGYMYTHSGFTLLYSRN